MSKNDARVVIVGAGMAGLTAAAYLTKAGYRVLLLEMNDRSGGLVGTLSSSGFYFDTGPRALPRRLRRTARGLFQRAPDRRGPPDTRRKTPVGGSHTGCQ